MAEQIVIYHESDLSNPVIIMRKDFYDHRQTLYREYFVSVVDVFIFNTGGQLILQKRGQHVGFGAGRLHTSVGGHTNPTEAVSYTLLHECMEEIGHPSYIVPESMNISEAYSALGQYAHNIIFVEPLLYWELDAVRTDEFGEIFKREKRHDFVGIFSGTPENQDGSVEGFYSFTLDEIDAKFQTSPEIFTRSFMIAYAKIRNQLITFHASHFSALQKYTINNNCESQFDGDCMPKPNRTIFSLISSRIFMQKDCCSTGLGKWFCPSIIGVVAGVIMMMAGLAKFAAGKGVLTWVGGAALGLLGIEGHSQIALYLGTLAAAIEVVGGLSIAVGCRKTSGYAALGLSIVMAVALLTKLDGIKIEGSTTFQRASSALGTIRLDLLLLAVFAQRSHKFLKHWCGMDCCGNNCETPKKK